MSEPSLSNATFKHVEGELYHYHETRRELNRLRNEILHRKRYKSSNDRNDPTGETALYLLENQRIQHLEKVVEAISFVYGGLPDKQRKMIRLCYWDHPRIYTWDGIAHQLGISKESAHQWRRKIIRQIALKLGWR